MDKKNENLIEVAALDELIGFDIRPLASTFNPALFYELATLAAELSQSKAVVTPDLKLMLNRFSDGFSEDRCLISSALTALSGGIVRTERTPLFDGCHAEENTNERLAADEIVYPFINAGLNAGLHASGESNAVTMEHGNPLNAYLVQRNVKTIPQSSLKFIKTSSNLLSSINAQNSGGNHSPQNNMNHASQNINSSDAFQKSGDKVNNLLLQMAEESLVLLKNAGVFPIKADQRLALMGKFIAPALHQLLLTRQNYEGYCEGYSDGETDNELMFKAFYLSSNCDIVVILLGNNTALACEDGDALKARLNQNQMTLIKSLKKSGKKLVGVVFDKNTDFEFDKELDALIYAPPSPKMPEALFNLLDSKRMPTGKLPFTISNVGAAVDKNKQIALGKIKKGIFFGYKDIGADKVLYPFGFGLSYNSISYKNLKANAQMVSLKLTNNSSFATVETVQLYLSKEKSGILRPQKQLIGFKKIVFAAKETKIIDFFLSNNDFLVFDTVNKKYKVEGGKYTFLVGDSSNQIKLKKSIGIKGEKMSDGEKLSDYVMSVSNIASGGYALSEKKTPRFSFQKDKMTVYSEENEEVVYTLSDFDNIFFRAEETEIKSEKETKNKRTPDTSFEEFLASAEGVGDVRMLVACSYAQKKLDEKLKPFITEEDFLNHCRIIEKNYLLSEEKFKILDEFDIKNWRAIERFSSMCLHFGLSEDETTQKTIDYIKQENSNKNLKQENSTYHIKQENRNKNLKQENSTYHIKEENSNTNYLTEENKKTEATNE